VYDPNNEQEAFFLSFQSPLHCIQYPRMSVFETCCSTTAAAATILPKDLGTSFYSPVAGVFNHVTQMESLVPKGRDF